MSVDTAVQTKPEQEQRSEGWWNAPFSVFQTNLQEIDAVLDVDDALDFIVGYGADTWLINTGGIASFYPTQLPFQTPSPLLRDRPSGDLIGDAVRAAHARGVRVISRLDFSKVAANIAREHPEWLFLSPTGERQVYNTLYSTCPNGDYYQHRVMDVIDEVLDRYPVDGFFFNWFGFSERDYSRVYHGVCHCANCVDGYAAFSGGQQLPAGPSDEQYLTWVEYSSGVITELTRRIASHVRERNPNAGLVLGSGAPIYYHEANNAFGREFWPQATAENVSARVIGQTNEAVVVNSVSFVDMPYRMAGEQPESFGQYLLQAISRGARPSTYIMGAPGRIPYANLTRVASDVTRFYRDHRDLYGALRPAATVGLVRRDLPRYGADRFADVVPELRGVYSALQEGNVPFDTLSVTDLAAIEERGELDRYDLLILPNLGGIPDRAAAALDAFADRGGRVLLTGDSAVTEEGVVQLAHAPALMGSGAPLRGESLWSTYVATQAQPDLGQYRYRDSILPIYGAYYPLVWRPDAVFSANVLPQAPFGPPEKCYGHVLGGDPGHVRSADGSVTLIPWTIGTTYHEFGITDVRDHLLAIVRELASQPVVVDAPEQVDVSVARAGESLVVHLINQSGVRRRSVGTAIAIEGVRMRLPGVPGARVRALVAGRDLTVEADGDATVVDVPRLGDFEVLVVESVGV